MSVDFQFDAEPRSDKGKGASRRLRRTGRVPAILYGAGKDSQMLTLDQNTMLKQLENEGFYSQILTISVDGKTVQAILRDLQRHPYKPIILHIDFQRIVADQEIRVQIPFHFINEENSIGVKGQGGAISHLMTEIEISCLPKNLPEYIEIDVAALELGSAIHLSEITLPEGVSIPQLATDSEYNPALVNVHTVRGPDEDETEAEDDDTIETGDASEPE